MRILQHLITVSAALLLGACAAPAPSQYAAEQPRLDLRTFFNGTLDGHGMFQDRAGKVVKRFTVVIDASWQGETGTLDERFRYSDGSTQRRVWTLRPDGARALSASAGDVVGPAQGEVSGNALHLGYVLALPVDGKVWNVTMDDWMFLIDERVLLNRTAMSKFGVNVGSVTLSMTRRAP